MQEWGRSAAFLSLYHPALGQLRDLKPNLALWRVGLWRAAPCLPATGSTFSNEILFCLTFAFLSRFLFQFCYTMLPEVPPGLEDSLKVRYYVVHGTPDPQNGPGLEQYWTPTPLVLPFAPPSDEHAETWWQPLVYLLGNGTCVAMCQHALTVFGYALQAQRLMAGYTEFEEPPPLPIRPYRRVSYYMPDFPLDATPTEREIHLKIILLARADRAHILAGTRRTAQARDNALRALQRLCAPCRGGSLVHNKTKRGDCLNIMH
ncbi:hypothetical protein B0H13DRAFT_1911465 [Mycena leptocephala]|nr:hypothetical protein B0H13DRAFT_1911465 [Mycena leptocephala]